MNLVLVPEAQAVKHVRHLFPGGQQVASCVNRKIVGGSNPTGITVECGARVMAGTGYADTEGTPWKAYYCPACAIKLGARS